MPKVAKELGALAIKRFEHPEPATGRPALRPVGGVAGLMLQVTPSGSKSWILRTVVGNKRRHIGLGSYPAVSLAAARERAAQAKDGIRQGVDPIEQKRAARAALIAAQQRDLTFNDAVGRYWPIKSAELGTERSRDRWQSTIERFAKPKIGNMRVADIGVSDMLRVLRQQHTHDRTGAIGELWSVANETASKLRGRIEEVLAWATVNGHRTGDNPARWKGNLDMTLPAPGKVAVTVHHPAVSLADAPAWFAELHKHEGIAASALEFLALTATRSGDVRGATWDEIDLDAALWTIPAARLKVKNNGDHVVPLSAAAVALLKRILRKRVKDCPYVFPAKQGGPLSDMALSMLMRDMHAAEIKEGRKGWGDRQSGRPAVVHGLRSTFRDWAAEHTEYPSDMAEIALAHKVGSEVEQAYRRGSMVAKRRQMMKDWATFLRGGL